jgi:HemK-related putative methylase
MVDLFPLREGQARIYKGKVIFTDPPDSDRRDAVFPLGLENTYFIDHLEVREGSKVLDLCTGSGILSLFAADKTNKIIATDISPRALKFAKFNAALNEVDSEIEFRRCALFESLDGMKFDTILVNPPFEPTPFGYQNYIHSDGGEEGLGLVSKIIQQVDEYLEKDGIFQMVTFLAEKDNEVLDILRRKFRSVEVMVLKTFSIKDFFGYQWGKIKKINSDKQDFQLVDSSDMIKFLFITARGISDNARV